MNPQLWWFLARWSGMIAWLMLTASVIWGVVLSTKAFSQHRRPAWLRDLHAWLGGLTVFFEALHVFALWADSYVQFDLADLAVPYAIDWKPGAVAMGIVAAWLLVAVQFTSLAMARLPRVVWRIIHFTSYATFWLTSLHAAYAGTDRVTGPYQITAVASIIAVVWSMIYRVTHRRSPRPSPPADPTAPGGLDSSLPAEVARSTAGRR